MIVLYYNPVGSIGGAEMCLLDLLSAIKRDRPDIRPAVVLGDDGPLRSAIEALGIPVAVAAMPASLAGLGDSPGRTGLRARLFDSRRLKAKGTEARSTGIRAMTLVARMAMAVPLTVRYMIGLRGLFGRIGPDLVQTNGMKAHLLGSFAAPRGLPVVWHLHDYLSPRPAMSRLLRLASRRGNISVVAVSRSVEEDARSVLGPAVAIRAIYNAVDVRRFAPNPDRGWQKGKWVSTQPTLPHVGWVETQLPPVAVKPVRVGLVATFARWKGHAVFLDAISRLSPDLPAKFSIIGGPIYRSTGSQWSLDELKTKATRLGVLDRVDFVGHVEDPAAAFRSLDVAVHASTRPEPFGRVIVEGMASGLAVVAIPLGGAAELFEDGVSAMACPPDDPATMADLLGQLILDANLRRRLGEAGRREVLARFDADGLAEAWASVYPGASEEAGHRTVDTEVCGVHG